MGKNYLIEFVVVRVVAKCYHGPTVKGTAAVELRVAPHAHWWTYMGSSGRRGIPNVVVVSTPTYLLG